jgi:hypothetical protein
MEIDTLRMLSCSHGKKGDTHALAKQFKTKMPTTLPSKPACYKNFLQEHHTKKLKDVKEKFKKTTTKQCNYETIDQKASKKNMELCGFAK